MKVRFTLNIGIGAGHTEVVELPDGLTDDEIEEAYQVWCTNYIGGGWERND